MHPRWGVGFEWLAVDPAGNVALIDPCGYGAVPPVVMAHVEHVDAAVDMIDTLPAIGQAGNQIPGGDNSYYYGVAERGLYVYEWCMWHGPYERLVSPTRPISVRELPPPVGSVGRLVEIPVLFSVLRAIPLALSGVREVGG